jgi:hypothetical protein
MSLKSSDPLATMPASAISLCWLKELCHNWRSRAPNASRVTPQTSEPHKRASLAAKAASSGSAISTSACPIATAFGKRFVFGMPPDELRQHFNWLSPSGFVDIASREVVSPLSPSSTISASSRFR